MRDSQTFAAHAERCHQEAEDSPLTLVRERALRAEAAWMVLAQRSLKTEAMRDARQQRDAMAAAMLVQDAS
ncbi:hypothetical protein SUS17_3014 [Sphingomonas sp. S17]|uniref:Uncharacterized protein n=2 Tax=Sphingomonas paucimobilis TaxID=13689 RepID=A0A411LJZ7_SPHPI|nr:MULTISPECIES: hypothetical protein [Sphingomonas]EGI54173.1 hypothetical protein SUS17_3014 [Sphingomonas sp. S17]MBQ1480328.1 hypothetical protein [Sphingomonas sp.]MCM3678738.1 hypothetical protein [Sphingomonas paucimobilis]MDG5969766.1 hypothetical protein [Sphingomonas paucimobilis]NNG57417.1 hypothetical protein [Sphingomonas paucimobilis]